MNSILFNGLFSYHTDILSAWLMIVVLLYSTKLALEKNTIKSYLIWLALMCDIPISLYYHCSVKSNNFNLQDKLLRYDVIAIFFGHLLLHLILCYYQIPLECTIISISIFTYALYNIIKKMKTTEYDNIIPTSLSYLPVIILHLIPIIYSQKYNLVYRYIFLLTTLYPLYKYNLIENYLGNKLAWSNTFMHIYLIAFTKIFYEI